MLIWLPLGTKKKQVRLYAGRGERTSRSAWFCCSKAFSLLGLKRATPMPVLCLTYLILYMKTNFCTIFHYLCIAHDQKTNIICRHLL